MTDLHLWLGIGSTRGLAGTGIDWTSGPMNSTQALFSFQKILQNFSDFPSHRIFRQMHEALNIDKI
jgi:hypothetical protein